MKGIVWAGLFVSNGQLKSMGAAMEVGYHDTWLAGCNSSLHGSKEGAKLLEHPGGCG